MDDGIVDGDIQKVVEELVRRLDRADKNGLDTLWFRNLFQESGVGSNGTSRQAARYDHDHNDEIYPHADLSSSSTQTIASSTTAYPITFNVQTDLEDMSHSTTTNPSRVTATVSGQYLMNYTAIADLTAGANETLNIWVRINGNDYANSTTKVGIPTSTTEMVVTSSHILHLDAGDYFELVMSASSTNARLVANAAAGSPTRPAAQSIHMTVNRIGETH